MAPKAAILKLSASRFLCLVPIPRLTSSSDPLHQARKVACASVNPATPTPPIPTLSSFVALCSREKPASCRHPQRTIIPRVLNAEQAQGIKYSHSQQLDIFSRCSISSTLAIGPRATVCALVFVEPPFSAA
ncbi:hypothetical protein B0T16DRAFT_100628 [Cercophora newfieldiana]|uniref:Uncharacterized protein n=1 Tax=Cercophora newfieldiana TaxID=92897 RepID=A0AA39YHB5_9PEZI|nr:hypothetical protein B0T16DRAFT_100628 [Cercophora newfieldiana]